MKAGTKNSRTKGGGKSSIITTVEMPIESSNKVNVATATYTNNFTL